MKSYPLTLEAVKKSEAQQWAIGDALVTECGPPPPDSVNDGSYKKLEEASQYLQAQGFNYSVKTLAQLRNTAFCFGEAQRISVFSWSAHRAAGSPEYLQGIINSAPKGTRITQEYIEAIRSVQVAELREERAHAEAQAQKELERAQAKQAKAEQEAREATDKETKKKAQAKAAKAKADIEAAREKKRATKTAPKKTITAPDQQETPPILIKSQCLSNASSAERLAKETAKLLSESYEQLNQKSIPGLIEASMKAANAWAEVAQLFQGNKESNHLSVVGE